MPPNSRRERTKERTFWRAWGPFLIAAAVILGGGILFQILRRPAPEFLTTPLYQAYFTHGQTEEATPLGLENAIIADLVAAEETIDLVTPGLDLGSLTTALIEAQERGVAVRIVQDSDNQQDPEVASLTTHLEQAGAAIEWAPPGSLGESFILIDDAIVWTGSWALSQQAIYEASSLALRFQLAEVAANFAIEFDEIFVQNAYGAEAPQNTPHRHISVLDQGRLSFYFTPEDDPLGDLLRRMADSQQEIIVLTQELEDPRIVDRLAGEAAVRSKQVWGVVGADEASSDVIRTLSGAGAALRSYGGEGELWENLIMVDAQFIYIFSQPLVQEQIDERAGFVLLIEDRELGQTIAEEFGRLYGQAQ